MKWLIIQLLSISLLFLLQNQAGAYETDDETSDYGPVTTSTPPISIYLNSRYYFMQKYYNHHYNQQPVKKHHRRNQQDISD